MAYFSFQKLKSLLGIAALTAASALTSASYAQTVFRVTTIPEEAATEQTRKFGPIVKYLGASWVKKWSSSLYLTTPLQ